jgi:hypothetical protein
MELRKEHSEGLAHNPIEEKRDQRANKTVSGRRLPVSLIRIRIDTCPPTAWACFEVALVHRRMPTLSHPSFYANCAPKRTEPVYGEGRLWGIFTHTPRR